MVTVGITLEMLKAGPLRHPTQPSVPFQDRTFPTPSGRFRFTSEVPPNPAAERHGDFVLPSVHSEKAIHAQLLSEDQGKPLEVRMSLADACGLELSEGDWLVLKAWEGRVEAQVALDRSLTKGVLCCDQRGWIEFSYGVNQVIPGILSNHGLCAGFYEAIVHVEKKGSHSPGE